MIDRRGIILFVGQRITSFLSVIGTAMIILQVARHRENRSRTQQRLLLGMSCIDFSISTVWLFTNLFLPRSKVHLWSVGNQTSCSVQGFVVQLLLTSILYNASLAIYYLMVIRLRFPQWKVMKIEPYMHALPLILGIGTAVTALVLNMYNPADWDCWIAPPANCTQTSEYENTTSCKKFNNVDIFRMAFLFGPLWVVIIGVTAVMLVIFLHVRKQEKKSQRWATTTSTKRLTNTRNLGVQSALYVGSFYITYTFPSITRLFQLAGKDVPSWLYVTSGIFIPIQGFFNSLVYFRPEYNRLRRENPGISGLSIVGYIIKRSLFNNQNSEVHTIDDKQSTAEPSAKPVKEIVLEEQLCELDKEARSDTKN